MKTNRAAASSDIALPASSGFWQRWTQFWFSPVAPTALHGMRFLGGLLFLAWLIPLTGERHALFGLDGLFDMQAAREVARLPEMERPQLGWSLFYLTANDPALFDAIWWGGLTAIALFMLGLGTRITGVLTWVFVVSCLLNPATSFDADFLMPVLAFYLMLGYLLLGQLDGNLSLWERILGPRGTSVFASFRRPVSFSRESPTSAESALAGGSRLNEGSCAANLALRLFQVHFALIVVTSTLHRTQFADWWAGVAYWYPLHPPFEFKAEQLQREKVAMNTTLFVLSLAEYLGLAWQMTFPLFAWRRSCRWLLLGGAAIYWLAMVFIYHMPLFGPFYAVACLSYLSPGEWQRLTAPLTRLFGPRTLAAAPLAGAEKRPRVRTTT